MFTMMPRKAAERWWSLFAKEPYNAPPEVAYFEKIHPHDKWERVTWSQIHEKRTNKIKAKERWKRRPEFEIKPCHIWVFYNDTRFYSGWWIYVETLKESFPLNFRGRLEHIEIQAMNLFPLGILPSLSFQDTWFKAFEKTFHLPSKKRKKNAKKSCWCLIRKGQLVKLATDPKTLRNENNLRTNL